MTGRQQDINDERIRAVSRMLDRLPRVDARIDEVNALLFRRGIAAAEFRRLVDERSALLMERDRLQRRLREAYGVVPEQEQEPLDTASWENPSAS